MVSAKVGVPPKLSDQLGGMAVRLKRSRSASARNGRLWTFQTLIAGATLACMDDCP